jgi:alkanesulfonate monooxygenase SsuD/methylene tetrahydromethanopterin reductase-like flavin-dependent oxidoreductase (luciferase family)
MKIGVQLPEVERVVRWPELRRMAVLAEQVGFDSLWLGDHYLYRRGGAVTGPWEAWTSLAAIAAVTERIELGPFVASLTFHNPAVIAKFASTVDEVSGGRLVLGVGAGWNEVEYRAFGFPYEQRVRRFEESFHVVRRLLAGEELHLDGEFVQLDGCVLHPPSARVGGVPLMIGSTGPRMLDITVPHVQAWNAWFTEYENRPELVDRALTPLRQACDRAGRDIGEIETSVALLLDLGSTSPRAHRLNPLSGSAAQIADAVVRLGAAGIDHVQLVLDPITEATIEQVAAVLALVRG